MVLHQRAKSEANLGLGIDGMKRDSRTSLLGHGERAVDSSALESQV